MAEHKKSDWLRGLNIALRAAHLMALVVLGASLLGAPVAGGTAAAGMAATGLALLVAEILVRRAYLREVAGVAVLVKLALVAWIAVDAGSRPAVFWFLIAWSALFAHAPAPYRHAVVFGPK